MQACFNLQAMLFQMQMPNSILNYFSTTHGSFLHAKGRIATARLMKLLDCQPGENILELGFGTGATLTHLASLHTRTTFSGYDVSAAMLNVAKSRLKFCLLDKRVQLHLMDPEAPLPAPSENFDKIYVESVLAIQQDGHLHSLLTELNRILKKNGTLIFNETIWLDSVSKDEAIQINSGCLKAFGIIQSNAHYTHISDWKQLLHDCGFHTEVFEVVSDDAGEKSLPFSFKGMFLSEVFNILGKIKSFTNSRLRTEWKKYSNEIEHILPPGKKMMDGFLVKAVKTNS